MATVKKRRLNKDHRFELMKFGAGRFVAQKELDEYRAKIDIFRDAVIKSIEDSFPEDEMKVFEKYHLTGYADGIQLSGFLTKSIKEKWKLSDGKIVERWKRDPDFKGDHTYSLVGFQEDLHGNFKSFAEIKRWHEESMLFNQAGMLQSLYSMYPLDLNVKFEKPVRVPCVVTRVGSANIRISASPIVDSDMLDKLDFSDPDVLILQSFPKDHTCSWQNAVLLPLQKMMFASIAFHEAQFALDEALLNAVDSASTFEELLDLIPEFEELEEQLFGKKPVTALAKLNSDQKKLLCANMADRGATPGAMCSTV